MIIVFSIILLWLLIAPGCMTFRTTDERAKANFSKKGLELKSGYVTVNERKIYYTMVGNDSLPSLFFLHGSPSTWSAFNDYMNDPEMLANFRMIGIDRPGFGYSVDGGAVNLADQSHLLLPIILELENGKPVYLAGHSLGAPVAIKLAADYPNYFSGIALISGSVDPSLEPKEKWRKAFNTVPLCYLLPGAFRPSNAELLYFKDDVLKLTNDFNKVDCRVMLIHGEKDKWVPLGNITFAEKSLTNSKKVETVILNGANHFIPWTKKEEVKAALLKMAEN